MRILNRIRLRYAIIFFLIGFLVCYFGVSDYQRITIKLPGEESKNQLSFNYLETVNAAELFENLRHKEVIILYEDTDYGNTMRDSFRKEFKKRGGNIVNELNFPPGNKDFRGLLEFVLNKKVRAIYLISGPEEGARVLKQISDLGIKGDIIATSTVKDPKLLEIAGESAEGLIISGTKKDIENNFLIYKDILTDPEISALSQDSLKLLAYSSAECNSEEITNKLVALRNFIKTGEGGEKPYTVYIVDKGQFVDFEG